MPGPERFSTWVRWYPSPPAPTSKLSRARARPQPNAHIEYRCCLVNATYEVNNSSFIEEAILNEVVQQKAEYGVIGKDRRARWRRFLSRLLSTGVDVESF